MHTDCGIILLKLKTLPQGREGCTEQLAGPQELGAHSDCTANEWMHNRWMEAQSRLLCLGKQACTPISTNGSINNIWIKAQSGSSYLRSQAHTLIAQQMGVSTKMDRCTEHLAVPPESGAHADCTKNGKRMEHIMGSVAPLQHCSDNLIKLRARLCMVAKVGATDHGHRDEEEEYAEGAQMQHNVDLFQKSMEA
eukprot:1159883-Pelagomonas_calceolata.AAC.2